MKKKNEIYEQLKKFEKYFNQANSGWIGGLSTSVQKEVLEIADKIGLAKPSNLRCSNCWIRFFTQLSNRYKKMQEEDKEIGFCKQCGNAFKKKDASGKIRMFCSKKCYMDWIQSEKKRCDEEGVKFVWGMANDGAVWGAYKGKEERKAAHKRSVKRKQMKRYRARKKEQKLEAFLDSLVKEGDEALRLRKLAEEEINNNNMENGGEA